MIATHAPSFVGHQIPNGQDVEGALLLDANHALCHVPSLFRLDEVEQGMFGAICVPEREDSVVGEAVGLMYLHVASTVFAIDIMKIVGAYSLKRFFTEKKMKILNQSTGIILAICGLLLIIRVIFFR